MAEATTNKSGIFAGAQKRLSRTKTKFLQNLGKAQRTTDDQFDELVVKIERQQESGLHLQKELKKYLHCLDALAVASKSFYSAVEETYEAEWTEEKKFREALKSSEVLWLDYITRLNDNVADPMVVYLASFPTLKAKVNKRGRKLVYYDNARHSVEVIQMAKKKDENKVHKAHEELAAAKKVYFSIHDGLHEELPQFHNSRVTFYAQLFEDLFNAEKTFHGEISTIAKTEDDISQQLKKDFKDFVYTPKLPINKSLSEGSGEEAGVNGDNSFDEAGCSSSFSDSNPSSPVKINGGENIYTNQAVINYSKSKSKPDEEQSKDSEVENKEIKEESTMFVEEVEKKVNGTAEEQPDVPDYPPPHPPDDEANQSLEKNVYDEPKPTSPTTIDTPTETEEHKELYESPGSNKPVIEAPPNLLYQVQATHPYNGEDVDELSFDTGEIIWVIPYEHAEDQDDGWVSGIKQSDGVKGVFPENFTRKLET